MKWLLRILMMLLVLTLCGCRTHKEVTTDYTNLTCENESTWLEQRASAMSHFQANDSEIVDIDFLYIEYTNPDSNGVQFVKGILHGNKKVEKKHSEVADSASAKNDFEFSSNQNLSATKKKTKDVRKIRDPTVPLFMILGLILALFIGTTIYKYSK